MYYIYISIFISKNFFLNLTNPLSKRCSSSCIVNAEQTHWTCNSRSSYLSLNLKEKCMVPFFVFSAFEKDVTYVFQHVKKHWCENGVFCEDLLLKWLLILSYVDNRHSRTNFSIVIERYWQGGTCQKWILSYGSKNKCENSAALSFFPSWKEHFTSPSF